MGLHCQIKNYQWHENLCEKHHFVSERNALSHVVKERAYLTLVCPVCEYSSVAWSPYAQTDINCVESIQHCAAHFVTIMVKPVVLIP